MVLSKVQPWLGQAALDTPALGQSRRALYMQPEVAAFSRARHLGWSQDGAVYGNALGNLDVDGLGAFALRLRSDGSLLPASRFQLRLIDASGKAATIDGAAATGRNEIAGRFVDAIAPLARLQDQGLDLRHLVAAEIVFSGQGSVTLDDLRFE